MFGPRMVIVRHIPLLLLFMSLPIYASVTTYMQSGVNAYNASRAYNDHNFDKAQHHLEQALIDYPHDAQLNYNLGCVYHEQHKEKEAYDCFKRAATDQAMQEQAYFNLANTCVALEQLEEAITTYEQLLAINNNHEQAQHNLEIAKKTLEERKKNNKKQEQQKKDQNKQQQDKSQKDQSKSNDQQSGNDQQNQQQNKSDDQKNNQQQQENQQSNGQQSEQQQQPNDKQQSTDQQKQDKSSNNGSDQEKQQASKNDNEQQKNNNQQQEQNKRSRAVDDQRGQENQQKKGAPQRPSSSGKDRTTALQHEQVSDTYDKNAGNKKLDKQLQAVLAQAEHNDEQHYKHMIKAHVKREMAGQFGQKNW